MRVGALRQVVPATLVTAFELVARDTACDGAQLELELIPVASDVAPTARSSGHCRAQFSVRRECGEPAVVIAGRELEIESIEVEDQPIDYVFSDIA